MDGDVRIRNNFTRVSAESFDFSARLDWRRGGPPIDGVQQLRRARFVCYVLALVSADYSPSNLKATGFGFGAAADFELDCYHTGQEIYLDDSESPAMLAQVWKFNSGFPPGIGAGRAVQEDDQVSNLTLTYTPPPIFYYVANKRYNDLVNGDARIAADFIPVDATEFTWPTRLSFVDSNTTNAWIAMALVPVASTYAGSNLYATGFGGTTADDFQLDCYNIDNAVYLTDDVTGQLYQSWYFFPGPNAGIGGYTSDPGAPVELTLHYTPPVP